MDKIMKIAGKYNVKVIEDAAQALGATYRDQRAGSMGLAGCFSFYPAKILGCYGDGGAITTNDIALADELRLLRDHYQVRAKGDKQSSEKIWFGYNSRLDNLQAAVLNVKMKHLPSYIQRRQEIAYLYHTGLDDLNMMAGITYVGNKMMLPKFGGSKNWDVFQDYIIQVKGAKRDELAEYLEGKGVEILIRDTTPNHKHWGLGLECDLPMTEKLAQESLRLPIAPELTNEQIDYVISTIKEFYA